MLVLIWKKIDKLNKKKNTCNNTIFENDLPDVTMEIESKNTNLTPFWCFFHKQIRD